MNYDIVYEEIREFYRIQPALVAVLNPKYHLQALLKEAKQFPADYKPSREETDEFSPFKDPQRVIAVAISNLEQAIKRFK